MHHSILKSLFALGVLAVALAATTCTRSGPARPVIGVAFETLQTEFWVAGHGAIKAECAKRGFDVVDAVADGDSSRQLEQVQSFIASKVDGIILVPKDAQTCLPMIKAANVAGIPIVLFNRPAAEDPGARSVAVVADNFALAKETVTHLLGEAKKSGVKCKGMILIGDLGDINAVGRRDGFEAAIAESGTGLVEVVARVPTEWQQEKAQSGVTNALQAHPDIGLIFTSSDFLLPSLTSALRAAGRYKKVGEPGHVILGGFDGDATAWRLLNEGYLDATGVQNVYFEADQCVQAVVDLKAGKSVSPLIRDPGFVIHHGNKTGRAAQMWGAQANN